MLHVASAMLLWAEDVDVPLDIAKQAVQHVHAEHMAGEHLPCLLLVLLDELTLAGILPAGLQVV